MSGSEAAHQIAESMRATAEGFCNAFVAGLSPTEMLDTFFASNCKITEHGPFWAQTRLPFLGTTFCGRRSHGNQNTPSGTTCDDYYERRSSLSIQHKTLYRPKKNFGWPSTRALKENGMVRWPSNYMQSLGASRRERAGRKISYTYWVTLTMTWRLAIWSFGRIPWVRGWLSSTDSYGNLVFGETNWSMIFCFSFRKRAKF